MTRPKKKSEQSFSFLLTSTSNFQLILQPPCRRKVVSCLLTPEASVSITLKPVNPQIGADAHMAIHRYFVHPCMAHRAGIRSLRVHGRCWPGRGDLFTAISDAHIDVPSRRTSKLHGRRLWQLVLRSSSSRCVTKPRLHTAYMTQ